MRRVVRFVIILALALTAGAAACAPNKPDLHAREYALTGEVVRLKADRTELTVRHDDVKGFMPAMTMPFAIKEARFVEGLAVGDLISATLVVNDEESFLVNISKTGTLPPEKRTAMPPPAAEALRPGQSIPELRLVDEDGKPLTLKDYRGKLLVFTFIYTRCPLPDYCPRMDAYFAELQKSVLATPALKKVVRLLTLSFDPAHDTPAALKVHARRRGADPAVWRYATAPGKTIDEFGARLGLSLTRDNQPDGTISHNLRTALMDRDGMLVKTYTGNVWSPDAVIRDLEALIK